MAKLIYKNEKGETLTFGEKAPFLITTIEGLGSPQNIINTSKSPLQDGSSVTSMSLENRNIVLEGVILENDRKIRQRQRTRLIKLFNPKLKGELTIERDGTIKKINCIPELAPFFPSNMQNNYQDFSIQLFASNPYWKDIMNVKKEVAIWRDNFEFPLEILQQGIEFGFREPSLIVNVINNGDVNCGVKIEFKASASVTNPSIFNVNKREFFKINKSMQVGEVITVTTDFQNKRVVSDINGVKSNAFNWIDFESTFLQLDVGDNLFRYDALEGVENLTVTIYYTPQYLGV